MSAQPIATGQPAYRKCSICGTLRICRHREPELLDLLLVPDPSRLAPVFAEMTSNRKQVAR